MKSKYLYISLLLMIVLLFAACGTNNNSNENDENTKEDTEEVSAEGSNASQDDGSDNADQNQDNEEELQVVNIQEFDFDKTEEDLEKLVIFNNDDADDEPTYSTNGKVNNVSKPYIAGEDEVLIGDSLLIDSDGDGMELREDIIADGSSLTRSMSGSSYEEGMFYLSYEDGVYSMDGSNGDMEMLADNKPALLKTDSEFVYYVSNPEDSDEYTLHAVDRENKEEIWSTDTIEFGMQGLGSLDIIPMEDYVIYKTIDFIHALDKESGEVLWELEDADRFLQLTEADDTLIGVTSRDNIPGAYELKAFDKKTGETTYSQDLPETFSFMNQGHPELTVKDNWLLIDMEQSVLGYDIEKQEPVWAIGGDDGFHTSEAIAQSDDTMNMDVALTPDGEVIIDGVMNHAPQTEEEEQSFIITIDPQTGDIQDGYLINENMERNNAYNSDYDYKFLITNTDEITDQEFQAFIGTVK